MNKTPDPSDSALEPPTLSSFLLSDVQKMRPEGWSRLVTTFGPVVYRWCRTSGVGKHDAADVVQDVFVTVARRIPDFERRRDTGSFRAWLATITRSRVVDFFRRQSKRDVPAGGTDAWKQLEQQPEILESTINGSNLQHQLLRTVAEHVRCEFETNTWQAFWMTAVEDKQASEVSEILGISIASVYQSKSRVLKKLRQRLNEIPA